MNPKITLLYSTARAARCFTHHPDWNQYNVLVRCCASQTFRDFELIVVTPESFGEIARLRDCVAEKHLTLVHPRATVWRRERTFAVSSARNSGLQLATGDLIVTIDDATEFGPDYLARIYEWYQRGFCVATLCKNEAGEVNDMRRHWFHNHANDNGVVYLSQHGDQAPLPQGIVSYPREVATQLLNGYDEHFDGSRGLEDVDFGHRLKQAGVPFVMDYQITITLHDHHGYPPDIIDNDHQVMRCCNTAWVLARQRNLLRANVVPYSEADQKRRTVCWMYDGGVCRYYQAGDHLCAYPHLKDGHPRALEHAKTEHEGWIDLSLKGTP